MNKRGQSSPERPSAAQPPVEGVATTAIERVADLLPVAGDVVARYPQLWVQLSQGSALVEAAGRLERSAAGPADAGEFTGRVRAEAPGAEPIARDGPRPLAQRDDCEEPMSPLLAQLGGASDCNRFGCIDTLGLGS